MEQIRNNVKTPDFDDALELRHTLKNGWHLVPNGLPVAAVISSMLRASYLISIQINLIIECTVTVIRNPRLCCW